MEPPRRSCRNPAPHAAELTPRLLSLADLGSEDDAAFDSDWQPSAVASAPPTPRHGGGHARRRGHCPHRPDPESGGAARRRRGQDPGQRPPHVSAASPVATPAFVGGAGAVPIAEHPRPVRRCGDNQFRRGGDNQYDEPPAASAHGPLDHPVEILAAAEETGVSPSLIAGMIRVESQGELLATSSHGARGLMQMMPEYLVAQGIPKHLLHDPATNISPVPVCRCGTSRRTARHGTKSPTTSASVATGSATPTPM